MIFTYNKEHVGDVLMVIVKNSGDAKLDVERKGKVARVFLKDYATNQALQTTFINLNIEGRNFPHV